MTHAYVEVGKNLKSVVENKLNLFDNIKYFYYIIWDNLISRIRSQDYGPM